MEVREIKNKSEWEKFVLNQSYTFFVQSTHYGNFYEAMGERSWIFGVYDDNKLVGGSMVVSTHARRGNFLYLPYGPVGQGAENIFTYLKKFAKENNFSFIRCSPFWKLGDGGEVLFKKAGFRKAPMHILAENTWILDLDRSEEELLVDMEKTHRYLIRRCEKEGVKVKLSIDNQALVEFNQLHDDTAQRHKFHRFSKNYIEKEFKSFAPSDEAAVLNGYLPDGRLDSSAIIMFYGNMAAYRHGASLSLDNKLPTSYLVQWEAIKEAKRRGMKWYNFWGIAPIKAGKNHPFYGITHFKKGFGGAEIDLLPCHDLPISWKYWFNWVVEILRSFKRGFK